jgi:anti-sigma factor RsiW
MTCEELRPLLNAYHDGEITDVVRIQEMESHIAGCPGCEDQLSALQTVSHSLREKAPYFAASEGLEARIRARTGVKTFEDSLKPTFKPRSWFNAPVLVSTCCIVALVVGWFLLASTATRRFESDLIAGHLRSLQASHLFDVPSSDQHTVKPWFQGKLDFSPSVPDLTQAGFPLFGGRLDYFGRQPAAAIVYGRGKHIINVFVMHSSPVEPGGVDSRDGYNLVMWKAGGLAYWAVSDVNPTDLQTFAQDYQTATGPSR